MTSPQRIVAPRRQRHLCAALGLAMALGLASTAQADGDARGARLPLLPKYQQECGSCHTAYPPGMLPAASWKRVMGGLARHYGSDATLDTATQAELAAWLDAHAGSGKRVAEAPPADRITRAAWFVREHNEVTASTWKLPAVKSASNCSACHTRADQGAYGERDIRIPR
jgi:hypothetical protein